MLEFRAREGRDPDVDHADADAEKLKQIAVEVLKSLGINEDFLDLDFTVYVLHFIQVLTTDDLLQLSLLAFFFKM